MNNFDIKSTRLLVFVVACCLIFVLALPFAYRNIPVKKLDRNYSVTDQQIAAEMRRSNINSSNQKDFVKLQENNIQKNLINKPEQINISDDNEISTDLMRNEPSNQNIFAEAEKLRSENKYESAIYEYEQLAKTTRDDDIKAKCYEEMALTYGSMERYGVAISYAKKAFNLSSTPAREILLARLYYKTGERTKAESLINAILNRDF